MWGVVGQDESVGRVYCAVIGGRMGYDGGLLSGGEASRWQRRAMDEGLRSVCDDGAKREPTGNVTDSPRRGDGTPTYVPLT